MKINLDNFILRKYGQLTILSFDKFVEYKRSRNPHFICECECGNIKSIGLWELRKGGTKSCGCFRINKAIEDGPTSGFNKVWRIYNSGAISRGYSFELSKEEFKLLIQGNCHYCGKSPSNVAKSWSNYSEYIYNGIDRKDNTTGYNSENCVTCCKICNRAKSDLNYQDFIDLVMAISKNLTCSSCEA